SFSTEAADRFQAELASNISSRSSDDSSEAYQFEVGAKAWCHFGVAGGEASVGYGSDVQHHAAREDFAESTSNAVAEHAVKANSARENTVTPWTEDDGEAGERAKTLRTIRNVNMRRTLNFAFREVNQEYRTRLHLTGIR